MWKSVQQSLLIWSLLIHRLCQCSHPLLYFILRAFVISQEFIQLFLINFPPSLQAVMKIWSVFVSWGMAALWKFHITETAAKRGGKVTNECTLVFGLDLKCLVLWQLLLLTCAAPTHAQIYLGKNTFIYLFVSPIDAGSQKCTQGAPSVKGRKKIIWNC